mmetsp:Transcript_10522/g.25284  ORF Transcript_10522/g.25284 Transcript_10522/m.25284 type:complete len:204 (-) Transcript_10522:555-1166(-)
MHRFRCVWNTNHVVSAAGVPELRRRQSAPLSARAPHCAVARPPSDIRSRRRVLAAASRHAVLPGHHQSALLHQQRRHAVRRGPSMRRQRRLRGRFALQPHAPRVCGQRRRGLLRPPQHRQPDRRRPGARCAVRGAHRPVQAQRRGRVRNGYNMHAERRRVLLRRRATHGVRDRRRRPSVAVVRARRRLRQRRVLQRARRVWPC